MRFAIYDNSWIIYIHIHIYNCLWYFTIQADAALRRKSLAMMDLFLEGARKQMESLMERDNEETWSLAWPVIDLWYTLLDRRQVPLFLANLRSSVSSLMVQGLSQDFWNASPKQQFQDFCPSRFSYQSTSNPYTNYI